MNRKKLIAFLIAGTMIIFSGSAIAASNNNDDNTLNIEKVAIEAIDNSISVKSFQKRTENAQKQYSDIKAAADKALSMGLSNMVELIVYSPVDAENMLNQFITSEEVNTNTVRNDAYSRYINLLKANYAVNIQNELTKSLQKDNEKAKIKLANGLISQSDARLMEINYLTASHQLNSFKANLESAYMGVNFLMGEDISKRYSKLIDDNIVPAKEIKSLDEYTKRALANRGEIVNAENQLNAQKQKFTYQKATYHTDYENYIKKLEYEIDRAEGDLEQAKIAVELEIINAYKMLQESMKNIESQQANYDLANSNYEAAKVKYDNNMITLSQLQNAQIAKTQAEISLKNAQLDTWLLQIKMDNACGIGPGLK